MDAINVPLVFLPLSGLAGVTLARYIRLDAPRSNSAWRILRAASNSVSSGANRLTRSSEHKKVARCLHAQDNRLAQRHGQGSNLLV